MATPRAIPPELLRELPGLMGTFSEVEIAQRFTRKAGKKITSSSVHRAIVEARKADRPAPSQRTAPVDIGESDDELEADLVAHQAARSAWVQMLRTGGLKPDELERAQKGLVRAGEAIRKIRAVQGMGTDENPETSAERLMAKLDEMAARMKRPIALSNEGKKQEVDPETTAKIA